MKAKDNYIVPLEELARTYTRHTVFDDFLTIVICCLSNGKKEELYLSTIKKYTRDELNSFINAFSCLILEMDNGGKGMYDAFGAYFEEFLSNGKNGQFFTPPELCDLMAQITLTEELKNNNKTVNDPACGSGRNLIAAAKINRNLYFVGADISEMCCKMTLINMCLNSMRGEVWHMNTITNEVFKKWFIIVDYMTKIPIIYEVPTIPEVFTCEEDFEFQAVKEIPKPHIPELLFTDEINEVKPTIITPTTFRVFTAQ